MTPAPSSYGYMLPGSTLARAAAGQQNPFGLASNSLLSGGLRATGPTGPIATPPAAAPVPTPQVASPGQLSSTPAVAPNSAPAQTTTQPTSAIQYDLNTDPAVQAANAFAGQSDEQAQASASAARRNLLLSYGDPNLAKAVLNDPTLAAAAAANPTSTLSQLATQHTQGVQTLDDQLNAANLSYSGYRTTQETKAAQDYQNALAGAASNANTGLGNIASGLNSALQQNQQMRMQALMDALNRALQDALNRPNPTTPTTTDPGSTGGGSTGGTGLNRFQTGG